ncbi:HNH endonuclease [Psychrobacter sp. JCM 18901]|uniref:HNH endonuclease n=1 Tax=Psychrobacter sp. JCM 18901 TaxID=1298609 RepID=UPI0004AED32D|nr:HNH endonuclease [Psychrobacter sp. JCM 18901]
MFEIGKIYNRRADIHGRYKGQQYGGIATPAAHPYVFIFTGDSGSEYGYIDSFDPNGTFKYTGEGQEGDMKMSKGNLAIHDHQKNNKEILLFEYTSRGFVRFLGTCNYVFHHIEERPDRNGYLREAIVFHLDIVNTQNIDAAQALTSEIVESPKAMYITKPSKGHSLQKLREIALSATPTQASTQEKIQSIQNRSVAIKFYAREELMVYVKDVMR